MKPLTLLLALPLLAQEPPPLLSQDPAAQADPDAAGSSRFRFRFRRRPSLRIGNILRVDFRVKIQTDFRGVSPDRETDEGLFHVNRARVGVEGRFLRDFEYEIEREVRDVPNPWRDVFVNYRGLRDFQIQAGKFKVPFGMDQLTGPTNLDFIHRSLIGSQLAPARDIGIMVHGRFFERGLNYQAGLFREDGENTRPDVLQDDRESRSAERTFAGRLTGTPLRLLPVPGILKDWEIGGAFTSSTVPEGLKGFRGRTASRENIFRSYFVHGQRLRVGLESAWTPGPFSLKGEFIHARDQRIGQGRRLEDLPDVIARGWYASGTWLVTGERKVTGLDPNKNFIFGGGLGAVELATRYEQLRFGSSEHPGLPLRHNRAANILSQSDRVWTWGVNWYLNPYAKVQANAVREKVEDIQRAPLETKNRYWMWMVRLQFVM
ncbi:MAG: OprO/OprP family phosphate-selective porin [Bryobacteraceae bacterium]